MICPLDTWPPSGAATQRLQQQTLERRVLPSWDGMVKRMAMIYHYVYVNLYLYCVYDYDLFIGSSKHLKGGSLLGWNGEDCDFGNNSSFLTFVKIIYLS